ncbi:hypothetical protein [Arthrobacter sp. TMS1-12-1]
MLAAIVGVWLLWVAPFLLGRTTPAFAGTRRQPLTTRTRRPGGSMMTMTAPQDDARHPRTLPAAPGTTPGTPSVRAATPAGTQPFTPRRGRVAVAAAGLACLVAALVTLVLGAVGVVSLLVPLACLAGFAAAVAVLRVLAVRARRARVDRAFAEAMGPVPDSAPEAARPADPAMPVAPVRAAPTRPTVLFDAEETPVRPLTAMEQRTAALAVAHGSSAVDVRDAGPADAAPTPRTGEPSATPGSAAWAPVEVPRPTYVDAAKAERQAPAPLDLPEAPKAASKTPIKASEAAARVAASTADTADTADAAPAGGAASDDAAPATGRINLDDVLQRRRA